MVVWYLIFSSFGGNARPSLLLSLQWLVYLTLPSRFSQFCMTAINSIEFAAAASSGSLGEMENSAHCLRYGTLHDRVLKWIEYTADLYLEQCTLPLDTMHPISPSSSRYILVVDTNSRNNDEMSGVKPQRACLTASARRMIIH